ncbi:hypothetical protein [Vineibacter terrae]|uniref:hypothetical protein n=1 Tax=Vineibacter terrae TaxID=2586908 RepID=UPI002E33B5C1|nr:hypothetical protein [Vineibacter terrae]HEX2889927.1 hypothetical protein [Vineibacter terrae]
MSWRPAPSVAAALTEANTLWPKRKRGGDGIIGDAEHARRQSDHNPDASGIVHAFDLTHDPNNGVHCLLLAALLSIRQDARVRKIIFDRRTVEATDWVWRDYTGEKPHTHHMHVSIKPTKTAENDTSSWWDADPVTRSLAVLWAMVEHATKQENTPEGKAKAKAKAEAAVKQATAATGSSWTAALTGGLGGATAVLQSALSLLSGTTGPEPARGRPVPAPQGYRRLVGAVPVLVGAEAKKVLAMVKSPANPNGLPVGAHVVRTIAGQDYAFLIEWHKHPPTDNVSDALKDWHRGVSTLIRNP